MRDDGSSRVCPALIILVAACVPSRVELYNALKHDKPVITVWEAERSKGGASLEEHRKDGRQYLGGTRQKEEFPELGNPDDMLNRVIDIVGRPPIRWVRWLPMYDAACACRIIRFLRCKISHVTFTGPRPRFPVAVLQDDHITGAARLACAVIAAFGAPQAQCRCHTGRAPAARTDDTCDAARLQR